MSNSQPSTLLPELFGRMEPGRCLQVLNIGPALPETVDFFSDFRCKLQFLDLFDELPLREYEDEPSLAEQFTALLDFKPEPRFDICLFWDIFNYLDRHALGAFLDALLPYLHPGTLGHGFAVHNVRAQPVEARYAIASRQEIAARSRSQGLPGYAPHAQGHLKQMLYCFDFERSMLLGDGRLEFSLKAKKSRPALAVNN